MSHAVVAAGREAGDLRPLDGDVAVIEDRMVTDTGIVDGDRQALVALSIPVVEGTDIGRDDRVVVEQIRDVRVAPRFEVHSSLVFKTYRESNLP